MRYLDEAAHTHSLPAFGVVHLCACLPTVLRCSRVACLPPCPCLAIRVWCRVPSSGTYVVACLPALPVLGWSPVVSCGSGGPGPGTHLDCRGCVGHARDDGLRGPQEHRKGRCGRCVGQEHRKGRGASAHIHSSPRRVDPSGVILGCEALVSDCSPVKAGLPRREAVVVLRVCVGRRGVGR